MCAGLGDGPEGRQVPHRQGPQQADDQVGYKRKECKSFGLALAFESPRKSGPREMYWLVKEVCLMKPFRLYDIPDGTFESEEDTDDSDEEGETAFAAAL